MTVEDFVNKQIMSNTFQVYCDEELYNFSEFLVNYIYENYYSDLDPKKETNLSDTQVRGFFNVSKNIMNKSNFEDINKMLKVKLDRAKKEIEGVKTPNIYKSNTVEILSILNKIAVSDDSSKNDLELKIDFRTPKKFFNTLEIIDFTKEETRNIKKKLFNYLIGRFFEHFYIQHLYIKRIRNLK